MNRIAFTNVISLFVAQDRSAAGLILSYINQLLGEASAKELHLNLHPWARAVKQWIPCEFIPDVQPYDAGFIKILDPACIPIIDYC